MNIIEGFFKTYYSEMEEYFLLFKADKYKITKGNYWQRVMKPSEIKDKDFESIEAKLGFILPSSFKEFYKSYYTLDEEFDLVGLQLAGNTENSRLSALSNYFFNQGLSLNILALDLIPFGLYNDTWYICLDMRKNQNDPKIVLFEMSNWETGMAAISHKPWFSNFNCFLKCMTDYQSCGNWNNFYKIDPKNNYLTAYECWKN